MSRTAAAVTALALAAVPVALAAPAAAAQAAAKPSTKSITLRTDAMPTRISATTAAGRLTCVKVSAGSGRDRRVWLSLDGEPASYARVPARSSTDCLLSGVSASKGTSLGIVVEEDILGPFHPRARGSLTL